MGRPYRFPSPNDVSPNRPHVHLTRDKILGLYNQSNPISTNYISQSVRSFINKIAWQMGWDNVSWDSSNECTLYCDFKGMQNKYM